MAKSPQLKAVALLRSLKKARVRAVPSSIYNSTKNLNTYICMYIIISLSNFVTETNDCRLRTNPD